MSAPKLVGAALTAIRLPVAEPRPRRREGEVEADRRAVEVAGLVDEHQPQGLEERRVADAVFGGMYIERYEAPRSGATVAASPETNVFGVIDAPEHPVQAEHELVGAVVVGEEPRDVQPVDLVGAGDGVARLAVQRVRAGADEAEQPRAVPEHVVEDPVRLPAARLEEARRERVRDDEVPVAPRARRGDRVERLVAREQRGRDEERAVLQLRRSDCGSRGAGRAPSAAREVPRLARELRVAGRVPDVRDRVQALPDGRLAVEREDACGDVGREPLADEQAVAVRAVDLPARGCRAGARSPGVTLSR